MSAAAGHAFRWSIISNFIAEPVDSSFTHTMSCGTVAGLSKPPSLFASKIAGSNMSITRCLFRQDLSDIGGTVRYQQPPVEWDVIGHGQKVSAVLTPEKVDMKTEESENITADMKNPANECEFQKLNADLDKNLGRLREEYERKAEEILHADRYGLNMAKRRNRLWMWFDRKTKFRIFPKILLAATALTVTAIVCYFELASFRHLFGDYRPDACRGIILLTFALVAEVLSCIAAFSSGSRNDEEEFPMCLDIVTNPAFKNLECNVYHEGTAGHR